MHKVKVITLDGRRWIRAQDFLRAVHAPKSATYAIPATDKRSVKEQRARYDEVMMLYISPAACEAIATRYAQKPMCEVRAWMDAM